MSNAELATSYAALILADDGVDITVISPGGMPTTGSRKLTNCRIGRQAPNSHQSRQHLRRRANMDFSFRQGTDLRA
jgi:hypothetical protein